MVAIGVRGFK